MAILILVGVMGIIFSRIITRPILELSRAAETVGRGNLDVWVDVHSRDEIGKLVTIFNRMIEARKKSEDEREKLIAELKTALNKVKKLSGILPICAKCKKIRDDKGYWSQVESYIREHSEAEFSHGLCPDCAEETLKEIEKIKRK
jgi:methyl-accepting chemotaxis protein